MQQPVGVFVSTDNEPENNSFPKSLSSRVTVGAIWLVAMRWCVRALNLVSMFVLARLLMPEDFGISALAISYIAIAEVFTTLPTSQALISFRKPNSALYDTAWTLGMLRGSGIAILMITSSVPVASLMNEPRLAMVIIVLALKPLISGANNPRFIDFEKHLEFSRAFIVEVGTTIASVVVTVILAMVFKNYWALVIGNLASTLFAVSWSYILKPHMPRFSIVGVREFVIFSGWLWGVTIFRTLFIRLSNFFVGSLLNMNLVGHYHLGQELGRMPTAEIYPPLTRALYPSFALITDDPGRLRANALGACSILGAIALPIGIGWALVAEEFVALALGEKWLPIVPIIQALSPVVGVLAIGAIADSIAMSMSRTRLLFFRSLAIFVIQSSAFIYGLTQFGLMGAVYLWAASLLIFLIMQLYILKLLLGFPIYLPILQAWRSWISVIFMSLSILSVDNLFPISSNYWEPAAYLLAKVSVGALTYSAAHSSLWLITGRPAGFEREILRMWPSIADFFSENPKRSKIQ